MNEPHELKSVAMIASKPEPLAPYTTRLTSEQFEALSRCAKGISLRFEAWAIVNALINGGYAEKNLGGVITLTAKGKAYVKMHAARRIP